MSDTSKETPVLIDNRKIYNIKERDDFDRDERVKASRLGEDWGDGFFVQEEPVVVQRNRDGSIRALRPLDDLPGILALDDDPPVEAEPIKPLKKIPLEARQKLVEILALRLFKWYKAQKPDITKYNPIYDGIPTAPPGAPDNLQPIPGTVMYPASETQVFEWLKRDVIGPRVNIINKRRRLDGFAPDYAVRISRTPLN